MLSIYDLLKHLFIYAIDIQLGISYLDMETTFLLVTDYFRITITNKTNDHLLITLQIADFKHNNEITYFCLLVLISQAFVTNSSFAAHRIQTHVI